MRWAGWLTRFNAPGVASWHGQPLCRAGDGARPVVRAGQQFRARRKHPQAGARARITSALASSVVPPDPSSGVTCSMRWGGGLPAKAAESKPLKSPLTMSIKQLWSCVMVDNVQAVVAFPKTGDRHRQQ